MTKLLLIALDGATLDLLQPWMDGGKLPLLARLFAQGAGGKLRSTVPWATPTAFASLATGVNPGQHGVFDFGVLQGSDYTSFVPTSGAHIQGKTLWQRLSEAGLRSLVVNMPMTYPAPAIDGAVIAGIPYPGRSAAVFHPAQLRDELHSRGWQLERNASDDLGGSYSDYLDGLIALVQQRADATVWMMRQQQPDFVAVHFLETDQAQHRFWQFMSGEPRHNDRPELADAILRVFEAAEVALQRLIDAAPDATVCLMSDHGFGPTRQQVWLNNWLLQHGFLALKRGRSVRLKRRLYRLGLSPAAIREAAPERLKLAILQFFERQKGRALAQGLGEAPQVARKGWLDRLTERLALDFYDLDWSRTVAFSTGTTAVGYIYLNRVGRDPQGIVPAERYEALRARILNALRSWDVVGEALTCEQVWQGAALAQAPDIVVRWREATTDARYFQTRFSSHLLSKAVPNDYASHRPDGLFCFQGGDVRPQAIDADLLDLTPTLLWLLDLPVPERMEGRVLTECFSRSAAVQRVEENDEAAADRPELSAEDEAAIRDSLRSLGYLE